MKLTNKQKLSIWKSLNLNEDFFDDFNDNSLIDNTVDDSFDEPIDKTDYMYHIHFIIYINPFIKYKDNDEYVYFFEDPKYKPIVESGFLSIKKSLDCILQATPIVTDYSKPKFCSSSKKITKIFPFMDNSQSNELGNGLYNDFSITLKTLINLSGRKNTHNIIKLFCSFWRLQQIYNKLITTKLNITMYSPLYIHIGIYRKNPYKKTNLYPLMQSDDELASHESELINFLNDKDETD